MTIQSLLHKYNLQLTVPPEKRTNPSCSDPEPSCVDPEPSWSDPEQFRHFMKKMYDFTKTCSQSFYM